MYVIGSNFDLKNNMIFTLYYRCILTAVIMCTICETATVQKDSGCGTTVGCFHDCSGDTCSFLLTWLENGDDIDMTFSCARSETDPYCAIGLSSNTKMGDDSVFECLSTSGTAQVYVSYNSGYSNSRLDQNQYGLSSITTSYSNGLLTCNFKRKKTFTLAAGRKKRAATSSSTYFDMNSDWYLLYAYGTNSGGTIGKHTSAPLVSTVTADFQSVEDISATAIKRPLIKAHGILMVFAWVLFSTLGIFTARLYKTAWPEQVEWMGAKPWFVIHRVCMISGLVLTLISFIMIFVDVGKYVEITGSTFKKSHPVLGIIVMCLVVINPVMAIFRPKPGTSKRIIFRVAHTLVGVAGQTMAIVNLFSGTVLDAIEISSGARIALGIYCGWIFAVEIGLFIYDYIICNKGKGKIKVKHELRSSRGDLQENDDKKGEYNKLKMVVLVVHILALSAFSIAVSAVIGSAE
ncbi:putative ferric-chelate reductase 1 isoform X2 [Mercenaria mercenaria]|uniref:putative ferric-chelate reductase 1 isoform X2 n=1 Tax=Mercenaria mercenaria TaxID=6596 RepID=UPI00234EC6D9|nr:putative ferric-chelate reductase 1 isoform X2 [Mercenaria mercenaria]